jgi:hypothetical protein
VIRGKKNERITISMGRPEMETGKRRWQGGLEMGWRSRLLLERYPRRERNGKLDGFEHVYIGTESQVLGLAYFRDNKTKVDETEEILSKMKKLK